MGVGGIPYECVAFYARENGFGDDQTEELHYFIRRMDVVFLEHVADEQRT